MAEHAAAAPARRPPVTPPVGDSSSAVSPNSGPPSEPKAPQPAPEIGEDQHGVADPVIGSDARPTRRRGNLRFVVIGDYGWTGPDEQRVAELVDWLEPDYVFTTGDNNYPLGEASTIDQNIGQYFSELIFPYRGAYPSSATENRFFPVLGNHDWETAGAAPYLDYFTLPGKERYYDVVLGSLHFFALDSDPREPDGVDSKSIQAQWLQRQLAASTSTFNVVAMHHPPYSSGPHGSTLVMQWPYAAWGADLVLAGHDHGYERLEVDRLPYVVSGLGGVSIYSFGEPVPGSQVRYGQHFGALVLDADDRQLRLSFFNIDQQLIDTATFFPARRVAP